MIVLVESYGVCRNDSKVVSTRLMECHFCSENATRSTLVRKEIYRRIRSGSTAIFEDFHSHSSS
jgi:hypothetical protein